MTRAHLAAIPMFTLGFACGDSASDSADPDSGTADMGAVDAALDGPADGESETWVTLIESDWTLAAGLEGYLCERLTVEDDIYIAAFEPIVPVGTYRAVLSVGAPDGPDGQTSCTGLTAADTMIFGFGMGTGTFELPSGVAMRVSAGQQLLFNHHILNLTDEELSGASGVRIRLIAEEEVNQLADALLMGTTNLLIPTGVSTQVGSCILTGDATLFSVWPQMRELGTSMEVEATSSIEGTVMLHDAAYDVADQRIYAVDPLPMKDGDLVTVRCTYDNDTGAPVSFGDAITSELCFAGIYRYPAPAGSGIFCTD